MKNLLSQAYDLLKQDERLLSTEGDLLKNKIQELAYKLDEKLIAMLLSDATMKEKFFVSIKDVVVFDQKKFVQFINNKEFLPDSYTAFKNKIGLTDSRDQFVSESNDVVLDRPYKDCVLVGGQDKEDTKRDEIFYNEVLGSDQIDRLLDPKVFTNIKKYTVDGEQTLDEFTRDENNLIKDNLIIKGNNLLALHSLRKQFTGKIKLIYIDPPYNTGNDGFKYNDKFNHSSWLTFMKNRLEIAKELLRDDGVIFVQCDDNEQAYLKVLMDEVFLRENFINCIIPVINPRGRQESSYPIAKSHEYIICFSKKEDNATLYNIGKEVTNNNEEYRLLGLRKSGNASNRKDRPNMFFPIFYNEKNQLISIERQSIEDFEIFPIKTNDNSEGRWRWSKANVKNNSHLLVIKKNSKNVYDVYVKDYLSIDGESKGYKIQTFIKDVGIINDKAKEHLNSMFDEKVFDYPKSEILIKLLFEFSTDENDIILDYHLGSGTTCAVAHKMGRQYIGVEQMDYIETIAVERMKKVIEGEQGGISKNVNRQGGGEFIYMEIAQNNEKLIQAIHKAQHSQELISLYHQLKESSFINYKIDIKTIDAHSSEFENLSVQDMKRFLIELIDKNALYINYSEINDESYAISEEDKALNKNFYQ